MKTSLLILFSFFFLNLSSQTIRYVKPVSSGTGDGSSWGNASSNLQAMIDASAPNDEVWVAAGFYLPEADINGNTSPADPRTKTFVPKQEVKLYGGFNGTETTVGQRDLAANQSILSGDIGQLNNTTDNSYHVITKKFVSNALLPLQTDGFVISGGNANVAGNDQNLIPRDNGGAVFIDGISFSFNSVRFTNCHFALNSADGSGGALYVPYIKVAFDKCRFTANVSGVSGGAVYCFLNNLPAPSFTECRFESNVSGNGGAIYNFKGGSTIIKCNFTLNFALISGGAVYNREGSNSYIETCSFTSNTANADGGALVQYQENASVLNSTFILNSAVQNGGAANILTNGTTFVNCTIARNTTTGASGLGGGLYYDAFGEGYIRNTILWDNNTTGNAADANREEIYKENANRELVVQYSIVRDYDAVNTQNITWGINNSTADPLFTNSADPNGSDNIYNTSDDGLILQAASPAIDVANNTLLPSGITGDITGAARVSGAGLDLGAYEKGPSCIPASFTVCPSSISVNTPAGRCSAIVVYTARTAGNPFPIVTFSFSGATTGSGTGTGSGRSFNKGVTTVTISAVNSCATATCTFTVTVNDNQAPAVSCPAPLIVSCPGDVPPPNITLVTATDNCPGVVVTHRSDVISNQICDNHYTLTRTYRATDAAGNFTECTQIITVDDQVAPVLTCPAPLTVSCASEVPAPDVNAVTITDNCGGQLNVRFVIDEIFNQTCANRYSIKRRYVGLDACENTRLCEQIITVDDQTSPVITCPDPVTVSCAGDVPAPDITAVTAADNCTGGVTVTHTGDVISERLCDHRYTISRTYRATDACGNFSECTQVITVDDQVPPVIICPADITVTAEPNSCSARVSFNVPVTDNCIGPVTIASMPHSGSSFPIGTTTVTTRATDACGNMSACTFNITVVDGRLPVITEQPADLAVCETGNAVFSISGVTNALTYQWQKKTGNSWEDIPGETGTSYTINNVTGAMNNSEYRVLVTGPCTTVASRSATLTVKSLPSVSIFASGSASLLPNETVDINSSVNPAGGTFTWYLNGNILTGASGSSIKNISVDRTGTYKLEYTAPNGCSKASAEITVSALPGAKVWVYPNPNNGNFQVRYYNGVNEKLVMKIFNDAGQFIYTRVVNTSIPYTRIDVDLNGKVSQGIYLLKLFREDGTLAGAVKVLIGHK